MNITIASHNALRVKQAVSRRHELLRMYGHEMPKNYSQELADLNRTIAAAVSVGVRRGA